MGYDKIEDYVADRNVKNPRNLIFGAEKTGLHELYFDKRNRQLHNILLDFVKRTKFTSLLYIGEDLFVENMKIAFKDFSFREELPRDKILSYAKLQRIPVEFGAFGHREVNHLEV
ncbi:hypothetical protein COS75_02950 [Candidatus Pacearchaeota archaeon CG06_land_8_20_14_3_00_35_12]|nr:MAG: hypothetical protein COS75_02950 [Candidatus Pacearchaeota archaeon CG06_land_8_20_14_3_00_35_12]